jgi:hypothetical protein
MAAESFALGDVLSITTGRLVSRDHIDGVYRILNHMTGDDLYTHQLPRACDECAPVLLAQHPQLAAIEPPDEFTDATHVERWLAEQEVIYGEWLPVEPVAEGVHARIHPLEEACDMVGADKVFVVDAREPRP